MINVAINGFGLIDRSFMRVSYESKYIIPTSTGVAQSIGIVIPELNKKLDGDSRQSSITTGSTIDLTLNLEKEVTEQLVNDNIKQVASSPKIDDILFIQKM